ncbi:MAG: TOBE domain-containing protein [Candidatus Lokiarchaeota archaeon]
MIICTHNRTEAIKFSDRLAVLNKGKISQIGNINEIFTSPKDEYAAYFIGYENIFNGIAKYDKEIHLTRVKIKDTIINAAEKTNGFVKVCIRPESIGIMRKAPTDTSYQNSIKGNIKQIRELGNKCHLIVQSNAEEFLVTITKLSLNEMQLKKGSKIYLNFKATDIKLLKFRTSYF